MRYLLNTQTRVVFPYTPALAALEYMVFCDLSGDTAAASALAEESALSAEAAMEAEVGEEAPKKTGKKTGKKSAAPVLVTEVPDTFGAGTPLAASDV